MVILRIVKDDDPPDPQQYSAAVEVVIADRLPEGVTAAAYLGKDGALVYLVEE